MSKANKFGIKTENNLDQLGQEFKPCYLLIL